MCVREKTLLQMLHIYSGISWTKLGLTLYILLFLYFYCQHSKRIGLSQIKKNRAEM